ncbi:hypothetical protein [Pseudomonas sp. 5P_3.1_Bac2]|uniref:hypothetical protein n=1 Tax=Pseudomonas sp. 5P_3.1_Bac2 TaxID=2971617 RepID=UPI0021C83D8F|nr:hypothetical protein [Pseudomonas sp. 5P_3.1_Bac2]MCU1719465.1 hypothetical protein [Pseudomonas sp. 5P_3.1_Bac2]
MSGLAVAEPAAREAQLHLNFHMALASKGQRIVGATLINQGAQAISHGYVVVTLIDDHCRPLKSILHSFGKIPAQAKVQLQVPIDQDFYSYRLASLAGFDSQGFSVPTVDDNQAILQAREPEAREYCAAMNGQA